MNSDRDRRASGADAEAPRDEEALAAGRKRFARRLANFGLAASQAPLLTDAVSSFDSDGNPR